MDNDIVTGSLDISNEPPAQTADKLLDGRVTLYQPARGYRAAIDPVLLAAAVAARDGAHVLDLGAGSGAALLCLAWRVAACRVTGLELQHDLAALARRSVAANGFQDRAKIIEGDLLDPPADLPGSFDHVMMNPPFNLDKDGPGSPDPSIAKAHQEGEAQLADWIDFALDRLRPKGSLTLIHRNDRLQAILAALQNHAGDIVIFPLWPKKFRPPKRVIVRARKGVVAPTRLCPGLVLHEEDGAYTPEIDTILRAGAALEL